MLDDGTGGDTAPPPRSLVDVAAEARERAGERRLQVNETRARLPQLRKAGIDGRGSPVDAGLDLHKQVYEQLQSAMARIGHLERALASNRRIGIAIGIIMERLHVTDTVAFQLLREQSQLRNQKLRDVAEEVIYTGSL
jgi:AmiR/NasT family two-component response regulator